MGSIASVMATTVDDTSADDEEVPDEVEEETEEPVAETEEPAESDEEASEEGSEGAEGEEAPEGAPEALPENAIDPAREYIVDGKKLKGEDIKAGMLMRDDYTRKTQALAEDRRTFEAKGEERADFDLEVQDFFTRIKDHKEALHEFEANYPDTYRKMWGHIVDEAMKVGDMSDGELAMYQENKRHALEEWKRGREGARHELVEGRKAQNQRSADITRKVQVWRSEAMKAAGLSLEDTDHTSAVFDRMVARHRDKTWTKEMFDAECANVAKAFKVKAPLPAQDPKTGKFKAGTAKPKLPTVANTGARRPPGQTAEKKTTVTPRAGFTSIRERYGIR